MKITHNEALKEIRKEAKKVGLVFKRRNAKQTGAQVWGFEDTRRGEIVLECIFWTAYENVCSGFVGSFNSESGRFVGINRDENE